MSPTVALEQRHLESETYDGNVIRTYWVAGARYVPHAQMAQADLHRARVRDYLYLKGLNRLPRAREMAA